MTRPRTSQIWITPKSEFEKIVKEANSISDVLRHFDFATTGANGRVVKKRCVEEGIDFSHIPSGLASNKGRIFVSKIAVPLEEVMIENSPYDRGHLKKRLIRDGILENKCSKCDLPAEWDGQPLVMVLDHINGIRNDNRKENLRLLCPNCNSQTSTFSGRNFKKVNNACVDCGKKILKHSTRCPKCVKNNETINPRKVKNRPSLEVLLKETEETGFCATGRKYGVTDNTIRKWIKVAKEKEGIKEVSV
jgi:Zn finger protein HypA/HybF involved in hydrogenase expression